MNSIIDVAAILISISALFAYLNHRFIGLPTTIGVMIIAMLACVFVYVLSLLGFADLHGQAQVMLASIDFNETLGSLSNEDIDNSISLIKGATSHNTQDDVLKQELENMLDIIGNELKKYDGSIDNIFTVIQKISQNTAKQMVNNTKAIKKEDISQVYM